MGFQQSLGESGQVHRLLCLSALAGGQYRQAKDSGKGDADDLFHGGTSSSGRRSRRDAAWRTGLSSAVLDMDADAPDERARCIDADGRGAHALVPPCVSASHAVAWDILAHAGGNGNHLCPGPDRVRPVSNTLRRAGRLLRDNTFLFGTQISPSGRGEPGKRGSARQSDSKNG